MNPHALYAEEVNLFNRLKALKGNRRRVEEAKALRMDRRHLLHDMQQLELEDKIALTQLYVQHWYDFWDGDVGVSFSGGLDSSVLLHLARLVYPDMRAFFVDTGLEYPEIKEHVKRTPGVTTVRPKMSFRQVIDRYGWPVVSKRVSQYVKEVQRARGETATKRLRLTGIRSDGTYSPLGKIPNKWQYLVDAPFYISDTCCKALKHRPLKDVPHPFVGIRAEESHQRELTFADFGVNGYEMAEPRSTPIIFWRELDIWDYIDEFGVQYASCYEGDDAVSRTGCMFCLFGVHMEPEPNRFQMMAKTHPKHYQYCIDKLGVGEVLDYIGVAYKPIEEE